jgi:hypothetical protein
LQDSDNAPRNLLAQDVGLAGGEIELIYASTEVSFGVLKFSSSH